MAEPTPERRAELRALLEKATPGEWSQGPTPTGKPLFVVVIEAGGDPRFRTITALPLHYPDSTANGQLIIEARNALPALLDIADERDRLEKLVAVATDWRNAAREREMSLAAERDRLRAALEGVWPLLDAKPSLFHQSLSNTIRSALAAGAAPEPQEGDYAALNARLAATAKKDVPRG